MMRKEIWGTAFAGKVDRRSHTQRPKVVRDDCSIIVHTLSTGVAKKLKFNERTDFFDK